MGEVAAGVKSHTAYGLGAYCYFEAHPVHAANGFQTPEGNNIFLQNLCTVFLSGNDDSQITHVINGEGGTASHDTADRPQYICKPSGNGPEPSQPTTEPNNNGGNSGGGNSGTVTTKAAVSGTACCQVQGSNQCMPESSQWWCNESSGNCLGACNDSGDKVWGVPGQSGQTTSAAPVGTPCCQVQGTNQCMPESSQWWCNESSGNCLGACNDSGDKTWGVPSTSSSGSSYVSDTGATEDMEAMPPAPPTNPAPPQTTKPAPSQKGKKLTRKQKRQRNKRRARKQRRQRKGKKTDESGLYAVYEEESFSADDYAVFGFAAIGVGSLLYGAFRYITTKDSEYEVVTELQEAEI